ncbi:hypothetical protein [Ruegeria atlantica]|uniref:hypothetical protein n=1 Tax=Ruegeria atlantica TaxID=81569 RepID=UPI0014814B8C|nr:hypothetical protein [Ruegeria atlantica]
MGYLELVHFSHQLDRNTTWNALFPNKYGGEPQNKRDTCACSQENTFREGPPLLAGMRKRLSIRYKLAVASRTERKTQISTILPMIVANPVSPIALAFSGRRSSENAQITNSAPSLSSQTRIGVRWKFAIGAIASPLPTTILENQDRIVLRPPQNQLGAVQLELRRLREAHQCPVFRKFSTLRSRKLFNLEYFHHFDFISPKS